MFLSIYNLNVHFRIVVTILINTKRIFVFCSLYTNTKKSIFNSKLKLILVHQLSPEKVKLNYLNQLDNHLHVYHVSMIENVLYENPSVIIEFYQNQSSIMMLELHHEQIKVMNQLT
jgi:hypothetical protein